MQEVTLNQPIEQEAMVVDDTGSPVINEDGEEEMATMNIILNDVSIVMKAQAEGRSEMPMDMVGRYMLFKEFEGAGLFKSRGTFRDLVLNDKIKSKDDSNALKETAEQGGMGGMSGGAEQQIAQMLGQDGGMPQPAPPIPAMDTTQGAPDTQGLSQADRAMDALQ